MNQEYAQEPSGSVVTLGKKAWTAYIGAAILGVFLLLCVVPIAWHVSTGFGLVVLLLSAALIAYKFMTISSYHLYRDDVGVWVYSGVMPWNRGVRGVKWRDLDEAVYFQTMWSWLSKSYSLRIGHRFTKTSEILLSHMAHGDKCVMDINGEHQELVRQNRLN